MIRTVHFLHVVTTHLSLAVLEASPWPIACSKYVLLCKLVSNQQLDLDQGLQFFVSSQQFLHWLLNTMQIIYFNTCYNSGSDYCLRWPMQPCNESKCHRRLRQSLHMSQAAHQAGAYRGVCGKKPPWVFLLPLDGMLVSCRLTIYTTGWREALWE